MHVPHPSGPQITLLEVSPYLSAQTYSRATQFISPSLVGLEKFLYAKEFPSRKITPSMSPAKLAKRIHYILIDLAVEGNLTN